LVIAPSFAFNSYSADTAIVLKLRRARILGCLISFCVNLITAVIILMFNSQSFETVSKLTTYFLISFSADLLIIHKMTVTAVGGEKKTV
jgi:hypothetical protein